MKGYRFLIVTLLFASGWCGAQEATIKLRSTVVGNQEQPKVLYIVPWQKAEMPELVYQPLQSLVDGVFREADRDEFLRDLNYRKKIDKSLKIDQ